MVAAAVVLLSAQGHILTYMRLHHQAFLFYGKDIHCCMQDVWRRKKIKYCFTFIVLISLCLWHIKFILTPSLLVPSPYY